MPSHPDILDERDPLRPHLIGSVALHGGLVLAAVLYAWTGAGAQVEKWGDPKSLGGGVTAITPVNKIPLPQREGRVNPVANDTESQVPAAPAKPQPKRAPVPEPDAIALRSKTAPAKPAPVKPSSQRSAPPDNRPNQVRSSTGQALTSPMFSQAPGGGGVGSGASSPFGYRFGWYEQLLREKVARNWRSQELDSRNPNPVVVTFVIQRDGSVRDVRVTRPSGNFTMDQSAQRAILMSSPFPPLPPQFERDSALIEFVFRLQQ